MVNVISISAVRDGPVINTAAFLSFTRLIASGREGRISSDFRIAIWISGNSDASSALSASSTEPVSASPQMAFVTPTRIFGSALCVNSMSAFRKRDSSSVLGSSKMLF